MHPQCRDQSEINATKSSLRGKAAFEDMQTPSSLHVGAADIWRQSRAARSNHSRAGTGMVFVPAIDAALLVRRGPCRHHPD
jgi:hypothetical protein